MKYYSELLNKKFDTADECELAEMEYQEKESKKEAEEKADINKLKEYFDGLELCRKVAADSIKDYINAYKEASAAMHDFSKKHGFLPKEYSSISFKINSWF